MDEAVHWHVDRYLDYGSWMKMMMDVEQSVE
jgi:hypothetical protein